MCVFFNDTATTEIYTLSLHDALPISSRGSDGRGRTRSGSRGSLLVGVKTGPRVIGELGVGVQIVPSRAVRCGEVRRRLHAARSEEHTSELQSRQYLVCRLLLEKKKKP